MGKLLLKVGVVGVVAYGAVLAAKKLQLIEKATVLADELLTKIYTGPWFGGPDSSESKDAEGTPATDWRAAFRTTDENGGQS